ncbi:MAG: methyltransferase domain-containing protein [Candidatus Syntrophonatronum acetioxidans]|uniref:Methyltransferase domain-containing protein n=1 Tax=Candidatus Syntrophonatronum acetioxidans TaxID=1795816 RepID=A0A424YBU0_9FIRM|nr:MAG: methyltransferase domain-containing protein [Candidatus Syntrophonatronum acetioxidans]
MKGLLKALDFSHGIIKGAVQDGDSVIDATAGNGHDTLFLARLVGEKGKVYSFDIQKEAIENTRKRLEEEDCLDQVQLIQDGHENLKAYVSENIAGVMFNLGYLPGSNHRVITRPENTLIALESSLELLIPGGLATLVVYTAHPGGVEEGTELEKYAKKLDPGIFNVLLYRFINREKAPFLIALEKK